MTKSDCLRCAVEYHSETEAAGMKPRAAAAAVVTATEHEVRLICLPLLFAQAEVVVIQ
jgi:hypothetical protein